VYDWDRMNARYVLDFLRQAHPTDAGETLGCEFRLLCSGQLYSGGDPNKNILSRVLLKEPFGLFVAAPIMTDISKPYPQELALRLSVEPVSEQNALVQRSFHPHWEIAFDLAALLTLLCRRLITVAGLVSETVETSELPEWFRELPAPLATAMKLKYWERQPSLFIDHPDRPEIKHYQPSIKRFDRDRVQTILTALPTIPHAQRVVLAARLYWSAMLALYERPDIAYLMLTISVESLANQAVSTEDARREAIKDVPKRIRRDLTQLGLSDAQIRGAWEVLAQPRSAYKFRRFMTEYITEELWQDDDLFQIDRSFAKLLPCRENMGDAMATVYKQRNLFVHHGRPYPELIVAGLGATMPSTAAIQLLSGERFPPLAWFERAVHVAIVNYLEQVNKRPDDHGQLAGASGSADESPHSK